jgi:hypothetical protein
MNFCDRKQVHLELALGMMSDENALGRLQIIQKCQTDLYQMVQAMVGAGSLTPEMFKKVKKPFEDTLYVLGVKDCNTYLPTDEEVMAMIEAGKAAGANKQPSPTDQKDISAAKLNDTKAKQIEAEIAGTDANSQLNFMAMAAGKPTDYNN